jgi:hypothetical protein
MVMVIQTHKRSKIVNTTTNTNPNGGSDAVLVINLSDHLRILENNNLDLVFNRC